MVNTCMYSGISELNTEPVCRVDSKSCREYVCIASVTPLFRTNYAIVKSKHYLGPLYSPSGDPSIFLGRTCTLTVLFPIIQEDRRASARTVGPHWSSLKVAVTFPFYFDPYQLEL